MVNPTDTQLTEIHERLRYHVIEVMGLMALLKENSERLDYDDRQEICAVLEEFGGIAAEADQVVLWPV